MALLSSLVGKREENAPIVTLGQLERILSDIQAERRTLETVLATASTSDLSSLRSSLDQVEERASSLGRRLDEIGTQAASLAEAARGADALQQRFAELEHRLRDIEGRTGEAAEQAARAADERKALQDTIAQAQESSRRLESLHAEGEIARIAERVPIISEDVARLVEAQAKLASEADALAAKSATALQDALSAADVSREAVSRVSDAAGQADELRQKVEELTRAETLAREVTTDLQALNGLAEHVSSKMKALEGQGQVVERALVDSRRVGEMLWEMEAQIGRLNEGSALASKVGEDLARLEHLHKDVVTKLEEAARSRDEFTSRSDQQLHDAMEVAQVLKRHLDNLSVRRQQLDTLAERVRSVESGLADAEAGFKSVSAAESTMADLAGRVGTLSTQVTEMAARTQALEARQPIVAALEERLDQADRSVRRTTDQIEHLAGRQKDLEALQNAFDSIDQAQTAARKLVDEHRQQNDELAGLVHRVSEFMKEAPQIGERIDVLDRRLAETSAHAEKAVALGPGIDDLAGRLTTLVPRLQLVDDLQARLSALHELSSEIDRRLSMQIARQAEIEQLRTACDGLASGTAEMQHRFVDLEHSQARLAPLTGDVAGLESRLADACANLTSLQRDQEAIRSQHRRVSDLYDSAAALEREIAGRLAAVHALQAELAAAETARDRLEADLQQMQEVQRAATAAVHQGEEQIEQIAVRARQIEERRAQLVAIEQAIAGVELRCATLDELAGSIGARITALGEHERIVDSVRQELDAIHEVSRRTHEDLEAIAARRDEIATGRAEVERLAASLADTGRKIGEVERRGGAVDEVRRKADAVVRMLDDVRITIDTIGEQKAMVDHVHEMLTRLDDATSEARGMMKALQAERKLAERIAQNVRTIHARAEA